MVYGNILDLGVASSVTDSSITKGKLNLISDSSSAGLTVKGDGGSENGTIQLNCSQNSHGVKISSPAHSSGQSYELILPTGNVTADKVLKVASVSGSGATGIGQLSFGDAGGQNTPMFSAYGTGNQTVTDATLTKVTFTGEEYDTASAYDTSTSRFTVPSGQAGKYHFDMRFNGKTDVSRLQYVGLYIYKNGSGVSQNFIDTRNDGFGLQFSVHASVDLTLAVGDYIEVYGIVDPTGAGSYGAIIHPNGGTYTNIFSGFKLIE
jgi:hypothetical protein